MELDYEKLGLRVGFEIHQELDTNKLFCNCPSVLREEELSIKVRRRLRPTQSELGEVDRAALAEAIKGKGFRYHVHPESVCLVELDEEPPHPVNQEAVDIALEVALLLNAKPVDEAQVMRKIVIDGSNTCGFQRTILIATDGWVESKGIRIRIPTICLEEDAARKFGEDAELIDYRLDRLGIPLVEIATGPVFTNPCAPTEVALYVGRILRATGKVKRGIGTIRQDINVSIREGARQEIKGIQELGLISAVIEREVQRQIALLEIRDELRKRGASKIERKFIDVTDVFSGTGSQVIQKAIARGEKVLAVKLPKFAGLLGKELQPGRRFGTELADHAKMYGKVGGIFHTDELPAYGISTEEVEGLRKSMEANPHDAVIIVAGIREKAEKAFNAVINRANQALDGVPEETRRALPDGATEFTRPLPGPARMYPETDISPIVISRMRIGEIKRRLPELPEEKVKRFVKEYRLNENLARKIVGSRYVDLFEEIVRTYRVDPTLVIVTLVETIKSLRREGLPVDDLRDHHTKQIFELVSKGILSKDGISAILIALAKNPALSAQEAVKKFGLKRLSQEELKKIVKKIVQSNIDMVKKYKERAFKPLMGHVMGKVRGRAGGELVSQVLKKFIRKVLRT